MDERAAGACRKAPADRDLHHWRLVLLMFVSIVMGCILAGCRAGKGKPLVGHWHDYSGLFRIEFTEGGDCVFDVGDRPEYFPHLIHGTYQITGVGSLVIDIDHKLSGEFRYDVSEDALQLTDDAGRRWVYRRMKMSPE